MQVRAAVPFEPSEPAPLRAGARVLVSVPVAPGVVEYRSGRVRSVYAVLPHATREQIVLDLEPHGSLWRGPAVEV